MSRFIEKRGRSHRGYILVATLACMATLIAILLPLVPASLHKRRQIRSDQLRLQASYIMSSVLQHSLEKIANEESYSGETIELDFGLNADLPSKSQAGNPAGHPGVLPTAPPSQTNTIADGSSQDGIQANVVIAVSDNRLSIRLVMQSARLVGTSKTANPILTTDRYWDLPE